MNKKLIEKIIENATSKTIVLTGASSGLGLEALKLLSQSGAHIIVGVRDEAKMNAEISKFGSKHSECKISVKKLDLTSPKSIAEFAGSVSAEAPNGIDIIINNAGIFAREIKQLEIGFEQHFFTNCLAPIILSLSLLSLLEKKPDSKIIFVSSISIKSAKADLLDMQKTSEKNAIKIYANSKRWLTFFALQLSQKLGQTGTKAIIVHPGVSGTSLLHYSHSKLGKFGYKFVRAGMALLFPSAKKACLNELAPLIMDVPPDSWVGPGGAFSVYGSPKAKKLKLKLESPTIMRECYDKILSEIKPFVSQEIMERLTIK